MSIYEAIGVALVIYMTLAGIAAHIFVAWQGKVRLSQHLDLGRRDETSAVTDFLDMDAQAKRLVRR